MDENGASNSVKPPPTRRQQVLGQLNKWLVWRLGGLAVWYWLIALHRQPLELPALHYIGLLGLLPVVRHTLRRKWWLGLLAILGAPFYYFFWLPVVGIYWAVRLTRAVVAISGRTWRLATSVWGTLLSLCVVLVVFLAVISGLSNNRAVLLVLGSLNLLATNVLFLCGLVWASKPFTPLITVFTRLWQGIEWVISTTAKRGSGTSPQAGLQVAQSALDWLREHVVDPTGRLRDTELLIRSLGPTFAAGVIVLFLLLVTGYAVTYLALHRAGLVLLQGLGEWPSVGTAWYYSLTISVTALHAGVVPTTSFGLLVQSLQLVNTVMFIALALFLFSYAMSSRGRRDVRKLRDHPRRLVKKLEELLDTTPLPEELPGRGTTEPSPHEPQDLDTMEV